MGWLRKVKTPRMDAQRCKQAPRGRGAKGPWGLESKGPRRGHGSSKGPRGHRGVRARSIGFARNA